MGIYLEGLKQIDPFLCVATLNVFNRGELRILAGSTRAWTIGVEIGFNYLGIYSSAWSYPRLWLNWWPIGQLDILGFNHSSVYPTLRKKRLDGGLNDHLSKDK